ncbi:MAG: DUF488 domain-containing protein [Chloroflexi bacterium]|nr:DUF488 domain-containing protein [Chloroflexota bacterium]
MITSIVSIGYERRKVDELIEELLRKCVSELIDIRQAPVSRRPEYNKRRLGTKLAEAGIEYCHMVGAGNPYHKLKADRARCLSLYAKHLRQHPTVISALAKEVSGKTVAILCYERNNVDCHRSILLGQLAKQVRNINVIEVE